MLQILDATLYKNLLFNLYEQNEHQDTSTQTRSHGRVYLQNAPSYRYSAQSEVGLLVGDVGC